MSDTFALTLLRGVGGENAFISKFSHRRFEMVLMGSMIIAKKQNNKWSSSDSSHVNNHDYNDCHPRIHPSLILFSSLFSGTAFSQKKHKKGAKQM